jgi:hypothetical protein
VSFTDPTQAVQPQEGQGGAPGDAPYAEYLNRIPEEQRAVVEPVFKDWDGNVTKKFQEHSDFRKQWEPYQQAGINQFDPQTLQGLVQFAQMDRDQFTDWLREQATEAGLLQQDPGIDPSMVDPNVEQVLQQHLSPLQQQHQQLQQQFQQFTEQQQVAQAHQHIQSQLDELKAQDPNLNVDAVEKLTANYLDDPQNAVTRAFEDYQKLAASIEQGFLQRKTQAPNAPSMGGGLPAGAEQPKTLQAAESAMIEALTAQRQM